MAHPSSDGSRVVHRSRSSPHRLRRPLSLTTVSTASFGGGIFMREVSLRERHLKPAVNVGAAHTTAAEEVMGQ